MQRLWLWVLWAIFLTVPSISLSLTGSTGKDTLHSVILSPRVGDTIDVSERDHFRLFGNVPSFFCARVFRSDSAGYLLRLTLMDPNGALRDSTAPILAATVFRWSELINHFEDILEHKFRIGSKDATIYVDGSPVVLTLGDLVAPGTGAQSSALYARYSKGLSEDLPLGEPPGPQPREMQYVFFVGTGGWYGLGRYASVNDMFAGFEARYARVGFPVHGDPATFSLPPMMLYVLVLRPFEPVLFTAEVSSDFSEGDNTISSFTGLVEYRIPLVQSAKLCWQGGAGYSHLSLNVTRHYGDQQISPMDTTGSYYQLNFIGTTAHLNGIALQTALVYAPIPSAEFVLFVRGTFCSESTCHLNDGFVGRLRFTNFQVGLRLDLGLY
jgi:hypothetical protein